MTIDDVKSKRMCYCCTTDPFLAGIVKKTGTPGFCSYCGKTRETIDLDSLATRIHEVLQEHFELTPEYPTEPLELMMEKFGEWERRGEPVKDAIAEMGGLEEDVADDIVSLLSARHGYRHPKEIGIEAPYDPEAMYEEQKPFDLRFHKAWAEFRREVQSRSRFFGAGVEEKLAFILGDLTVLKTPSGIPVIREINPEDQRYFFWRGRKAQSPEEIERILESPALELGPPPPRVATAGRMNAQGISMFYGATEQSTCVSELRSLVGSSIVVGQFELLRPVKLLDLGALSEAFVSKSYFDPEYAVHKERTAFLRQLVGEISRPLLPEDELLEYVPTQVVAEYLGQNTEPKFDGIIYPSSQTGGSGENVVLFNHSSRLDPYALPVGSSVEVEIPIKKWFDEDDDFYEGIWVTETVPSNIEEQPPKRKETPRIRTTEAFRDYLLLEQEDDRSLTLRLDTASIAVLEISAVSYNSKERSVMRNRQTQEEREAFRQRLAGMFNYDELFEDE